MSKIHEAVSSYCIWNLGHSRTRGISQHIGETLSFTIEHEFGDIKPFVECRPRGIVRETEGSGRFYEFEVISGTGNSGQLRVLAASSEKGCLPADAP